MRKWCMKVHLTDRAGTIVSMGGLDEENLTKAISVVEKGTDPAVRIEGPDTVTVIPRTSILFTEFGKEGF